VLNQKQEAQIVETFRRALKECMSKAGDEKLDSTRPVMLRVKASIVCFGKDGGGGIEAVVTMDVPKPIVAVAPHYNGLVY
jgi:hypothetical protein